MTTIPEPQHTGPSHAPITSAPTNTRNWTTTLGISLGIVTIVLIVGVFATANSLPGQPLYSLKIHGLEAGVQATHVRSAQKAAYQVTRMQTRLDEVKQLATQTAVSDTALDALVESSTAHWNTLALIASTSIDSAFPKTELLTTVNEFASVAGAIEEIAENDPELVRAGDSIEDIRQDAVRLYRDRIESFVATETPETAYAYLGEQLQLVQTVLESSSFPEKTMRSSENYLDRVEPAVASGNAGKALLAVGETYRIVASATYIGDSGAAEPATPDTDTATSTPPNDTEAATTTLSATTTSTTTE